MKDIAVNSLSQSQRRLLQLGVGLLLCLFLIGYFLKVNRVKNTTVYFENGALQVFDDPMTFEYPDKLEMNSYPNILIVKPEEQKTYIYDLEKKKLIKVVEQVALDFKEGQLLYNKEKTTYLDKKNLNILCGQGIIKHASEILCLTRQNLSGLSEKIVSIDTESNKVTDIYTSARIITDIAIVEGQLVIGEIDPATKTSYIVVNEKPIEVPSVVSTIYTMQSKPYFASFKGALNPDTEKYYELGASKASIQQKGKIVFYK